MMLLPGILLFSAAFFLTAHHLIRQYKTRAVAMEEEWLKLVNRGLSREFFFLEIDRMQRGLRLFAGLGLLGSLCTLSPLPLTLSLVALWAVPHFSLKFFQRVRRSRFQKQFSNCLAPVASILRAGHSFERALQSLSENQPNPLSQEMELVLKEIRLGATVDEALHNLLNRFPDRNLEILIHAISISRRVGSNLAEVFSKVSEMVETRNQLRNRLSSLTAQGRVQAVIAVIMPIALLVIVQMMAPDYLEPLFYTTAGHLILGGCAVALTIGGIWIHKITHMELMR